MNPLALLGPERPLFIVGGLAALGVALSTPLIPTLVIGPLFEGVLLRGQFELVPSLIWRLGALVLLAAGALFLQDALFGLGAARFAFRVRATLLRRTLEGAPTSNETGRLTRLALDIRELELFFAGELTVLVAQGLTAVAALVALILQAPKLALTLAIVGVPLVLLTRMLTRGVDRAAQSAQQAAEGAASELNGALIRLELIKAYQLERLISARFHLANEAQNQASLRRYLITAALAPGSQLIIGAGAIVLMLVAFNEVRSGQLSPGFLTAFLSTLGLLIAPLQMVMRASGRIAAVRGSARTLNKALSQPNEPETGEGELPPDKLRTPPKLLVLKDVRARYVPTPRGVQIPDQTDPTEINIVSSNVPQGVSLHLTAGTLNALIGSSGAGKTSLLRVLLRFLDYEGKIELDGLELRTLKRANARALFAFVPQLPLLFPGTIAENLRLIRPEASDAEINLALTQAGAAHLPPTLRLASDGSGLSGGEQQRVAIARALLSRAPILLMDEPTSALDAETERAICTTLSALKGQRTMLVVTHRPAIQEIADQVIMLEQGQAG